MADVRPFAALRYTAKAGPLANVLSPPYDVISPDERSVIGGRSPHNVVHIELPAAPASGGDPYAEAARLLQSWRAEGVMALDGEPALYVHDQAFEHDARRYRRRVLYVRLRLEPWDARAVLPHEWTMGGPKADRLSLLRATRTNVSPVYALYRDPDGDIERLIEAAKAAPLGEAATPDSQRHRLAAVLDRDAVEAVAAALRERTLYIADGHHRYETALAYRDEWRGPGWTGEEPENFALVGLTAAEDPGLLVLPIHRLIAVEPPPDALERLSATFDVEHLGPPGLERALERLRDAGRRGPAFVAIGLGSGLTLLTLRDAAGQLDAAALRELVFERALGLSDLEGVTYTEDAAFALGEVRAGRQRLAFLLNPTPVERILAVAESGERLPQKSTFFHPKLPAGLVLYAFE